MPERPLVPGTRVRVVGGPWPERVASHGAVASVPPESVGRYPVVGLGRNEVLVLLDRDPIGTSGQDGAAVWPVPPSDHEWWTCVYDRNALVVQVPCPRGCNDGALHPDPGDDLEDQLHPRTCVTCDGMGEVDADA